VRRFRCRIDRRRFKTCRSPKAYRVGTGRHVFRVRAIGLTGFTGPVTKHAFRVYSRRQWPVGEPPPGFARNH
jgi:hypothetical protein